jgi:D-3-phosphoglycerate dehydrogenase / 2-oxoglutarate reductase
VFTTPGLNSVAVAELSVGLLLAAARRIPYLDYEVKHGRWTRFQGGTQLAGRTLGVIGFGNIGQRVAKVALALGMEVVGYDPVADVSAIMPEVHAAADLDELLPRCDAISLHVPLLDSTVGLIGRRELSLLRPGAILVNTARSPIVDEPALVDALTDGRLAAAGLDLTEDAALPADHPLRVLDNVVLTPHIGGSTQDALDAVAVQAVDNVYGYLTGTLAPTTHCVNPETLDEKDRVTA